MAPVAAFVSFRFGPTDGVSVVTRTWIDAFRTLGFDVATVAAGVTPWSDVEHRSVPGLGIEGPGIEGPGPDRPTLERALADADLVVVENLLTIPINLGASRVVAGVLAGRPALLHHHDPPWHRDRFAHVTELPPTDPSWRHIAITSILGDELDERGIASTVIRNRFTEPRVQDAAALAELRAAVRTSIGVTPEEVLLAHPVRAIERKNLPAAISLAEALGATYWLLGPPEEGYDDELDRLLADASCRVVHQRWTDTDGIYAAADHVVFPSTWEGFGNPPIEASLRRRTVSVGTYPVADELRGLGFEWFEADDVEGIRRAITHPDDAAVVAMLDTNEHVARTQLSVRTLGDELRRVLDEAGWST